MILQYFSSLTNVIYCTHVKWHFPELWNTLERYLQHCQATLTDPHNYFRCHNSIISANFAIIIIR